MRLCYLSFLVALLVLLPRSSGAEETYSCSPTPNVLPSQDVDFGRCLFNSLTAFGQDTNGPFAACSRCHYGSEKSDEGVHLVRVANRSGKTTDVLRKTPSLLKAAHNAPFGADGRFATAQDAAKAAILSPVEMRGKSVTPDQLDALAAFVLGLPDSDPESTANFVQPPEPDPATLTLIATGRSVFFGKGHCSTCHAGADLSNHKITTNQVHLTFSAKTDAGGGFVGTGAAQTFKVPSLFYLFSDRPMHNGGLTTVAQIVFFYNESLALGLTYPELSGLAFWLHNCLDPRRTAMPSTC